MIAQKRSALVDHFAQRKTAGLSTAVAVTAAALAGVAGAAVTRDESSLLTLVCVVALLALLAARVGTLSGMVILISFLLPMYDVGWFEAGGSSIGLLSVVLVALLAVSLAAGRGWRVLLRTRETWLVLAFALAVAFSLAAAPRTDLSTHLAKGYFARSLLLPLTLAAAVFGLGRLDGLRLLAHVRTAVVAAGVVGSLLSIAQVGFSRGYVVPSRTAVYVDQFVGIRAIGLSEAPLTWGAFLVVPIGLLTATAVRRTSIPRLTLLLTLLLGLILSESRSAWLAAAALLPLTAALAPGPLWRRLAPFAVAGCSVLIALQFQNFQESLGGAGTRQVRTAPKPAGPPPGAAATPRTTPAPATPLPGAKIGSGRLGGDESAHFRYLITRAELELGRRHPLTGVGLGNLGPALAELPRRYVNPKQGLTPGVPIEKHNTYAGLFAELGVPGALTFLVLLLGCGYILFRSRRAFARASDEAAVVEGLLGALLATAVIAGFTDVDRHVFLWWIIGLAIGISMIVERQRAVGLQA